MPGMLRRTAAPTRHHQQQRVTSYHPARSLSAGISVPSGLVDGMPVGFQIMAAPLHEETMLRVAYAYERGHKLRPDL